MLSGNSITDTATANLSVTNLRLEGGSVTLDSASHSVSNLVGSATGNFTFNNGASALALGSISGIGGDNDVSSGGSISISTSGAGSNITIADIGSPAVISTGTANQTVTITTNNSNIEESAANNNTKIRHLNGTVILDAQGTGSIGTAGAIDVDANSVELKSDNTVIALSLIHI